LELISLRADNKKINKLLGEVMESVKELLTDIHDLQKFIDDLDEYFKKIYAET
jgi:hypothetical protein